MMQSSFSTKLALSVLIITYSIGPANANCDVPRMLSVMTNLPKPAKKIEVEETKRETTNFGGWTINLDRKGVPQSIVRNLNGETRYEEVTYVRFKSEGLAIANRIRKYTAVAADGSQNLEIEFTAHSVLCDDKTVVTVLKNNRNLVVLASELLDAASALKSAEADKKRLFESPEVKTYVDKMKRW
jgi:alpha-glucosidase (family GH31 glycosyl hydrolase)